MPTFRVLDYIFQARTQEGAVAQIMLLAPQVGRSAVMYYLREVGPGNVDYFSYKIGTPGVVASAAEGKQLSQALKKITAKA